MRKENLFNPEIGNYTAYSIEVYRKAEQNPLCYIPDVFADFQKAEEFINLCNQYQPEPVHLEELCIDFIQ